jgi:uncharacterized protein (TIGR02996 family)
MSTLREALEATLVEHPDDLATHAAYADHLAEEGDPRGELIQVQLALEEPRRPAAERKRLQEREQELLRAHQAVWLGKLARHVDPRMQFWSYRFARGWLDELSFSFLPLDLARDVAAEPATRLLRRLAIGDPITSYNASRYGIEIEDETEAEEEEDRDAPKDALVELARSPYLGNVRAFHLGDTDGFTENASGAYPLNSRYDLYTAHWDTWDFIAKLPRLQELYLFTATSSLWQLFASKLPHLRILQVYLSDEYPLKELAANASLGELTHLSLHPIPLARDDSTDSLLPLRQVREVLYSPHLSSLTHLRLHQSDIGDAGCDEIVRSRIFLRLKFLDLARGCITDAGARLLAGCVDLPNLDVLDVSCNALTRVGITALEKTGITVRASDQHELADNEHLYEGEME